MDTQSKTLFPMVPVPQALESVLTETAKAWMMQQFQLCSDKTQKGLVSENYEQKVDLAAVPSPLSSLIGQISAKDVRASHPGYPDHNSSIMDGYAIRTIDLGKAKEEYEEIYSSNNMRQVGNEEKEDFVLDFTVVDRVFAGDSFSATDSKNGHIPTRSAVYVTTGAVVPADYDAVIPVEDTAILPSNGNGNQSIHIIPSKIKSVLNSTKPWTWIRTVGSDIPSGTTILEKGEKIQPVHVALLTQLRLGPDDLQLQKIPRVGVLSTGNELITHSTNTEDGGQKLSHFGKIPDANRPLLLSQLHSYGNCVPLDLGIVTDDEGLEKIANRLNEALWGVSCQHDNKKQQHSLDNDTIDVLITSGGISMGEKDVMEKVFVEGMGGKVHFGRMNMKPGKPTTFITIDRTDSDGKRCKKLIFALPGNPVSASVCTELLVRPCLDLLHYGVDTDIIKNQIGANTFQSIDEILEHSDINDEASPLKSFVQCAAENAWVHNEVMAAIASDIVLDQGRPEYHRVTLRRVAVSDSSPSENAELNQKQYTYEATSTGKQRSSIVLSLRNADGLMVLPRGGPSGCGYAVAKKGKSFPVLLFSPVSSSFSSGTRFKESMHRGVWSSKLIETERTSVEKMKVGVVLCTSGTAINSSATIREGFDRVRENLLTTLKKSFGGDSQASILSVCSCHVPIVTSDIDFTQNLSSIISGPEMKGTNIIIVIVLKDPLAGDTGSSSVAFHAGLAVNLAVRPLFVKEARSMAVQIRKGAASQNSLAAVFENAVGTVRGGSAVLITCTDIGLDGAISSARGLLLHLVSF